MAKLTPSATACRAKDPNKCKYHVAVRSMNEALSSGDYIKYEAAKKIAEQHINDKENIFSFKQKEEVKQRWAEQQTLRAKEHPSSILHRSLILEVGDRKAKVGKEFWEVAPFKEDAGAVCETCNKYLTRKSLEETYDGDKSTCPHCNRQTYVGVGGPRLIKQALANLDSATTKRTVWYHTTSDPNWYESISKEEDAPVVHAGTMFAAWMRAKVKSYESGSQSFYIYEVHLKDSSEVSDLLYNDEDDYENDTPRHPRKTSETGDGFETNKVMRYVNWWEEPGSVSIMANASLFTVKNKRKMDLSNPYQEQ